MADNISGSEAPGGIEQEKIAELTAIIQTVRDRVRSRYPEPHHATQEAADSHPRIRIPIADLMPVVHARDAAQAKIAAIGSVNPRAGGLKNRLIQLVKRTIARALRWFVRDQVTFNRETISAVEAVLEALNEHNRSLVSLASQTNEQVVALREELAARVRELSTQIDVRAEEISALVRPLAGQMDLLKEEAAELKDVRRHWIDWRVDWERKLATNEIQFLRSTADLQGAFQHRTTQMESNFRDVVKGQHNEYLAALDRTTIDIQKQLFVDLERFRREYEKLIHSELRVIRQRGLLSPAVMPAAPSPAVPAQAVSHVPPAAASSGDEIPGFDYTRFSERFRGPEEYVRHNQEIYKAHFEGCQNVLDVGCGRGEFLEILRDMGIPARGIDLGEESIALCRSKGLRAEVADLFEYLAAQPEEEFDGILISQVVEHLDPHSLPSLIRLCAAKTQRGGVLAIETPNPECLAIFATHFYLDPTHKRPVPSQLLSFYMDEAGYGELQVYPLSPAIETLPELAELPEHFRNRFFGGLDFAIVGRRL